MEVRIYKNPCLVARRRKKDGGITYSESYSLHQYTLKRHYHDAEEVALIRAELAKGRPKRVVAAEFGIKSYPRLKGLLQRFPEVAPPPAPPAPPAPPLIAADLQLTDAELEALLAELRP